MQSSARLSSLLPRSRRAHGRSLTGRGSPAVSPSARTTNISTMRQTYFGVKSTKECARLWQVAAGAETWQASGNEDSMAISGSPPENGKKVAGSRCSICSGCEMIWSSRGTLDFTRGRARVEGEGSQWPMADALQVSARAKGRRGKPVAGARRVNARAKDRCMWALEFS